MATQLQLRRGTTQANDLFTGANGEVTVDTTKHGLRVHDGSTQGGYLVDTVVFFQRPSAENNYTWARKYASGWVEQGGTIVGDATTKTINLPVAMADTNYQVTVSHISSSTDNLTRRAAGITTKNTTSFTSYTPSGDSKDWVVYGLAA